MHINSNLARLFSGPQLLRCAGGDPPDKEHACFDRCLARPGKVSASSAATRLHTRLFQDNSCPLSLSALASNSSQAVHNTRGILQSLGPVACDATKTNRSTEAAFFGNVEARVFRVVRRHTHRETLTTYHGIVGQQLATFGDRTIGLHVPVHHSFKTALAHRNPNSSGFLLLSFYRANERM